MNVWQVMAIAQHHGTPTRLLDWSLNADTALHFLTHNAHELAIDGAVWVVNPHALHELLPDDLKEGLTGGPAVSPGVFREERLSLTLESVQELDALATAAFVPAFFYEPAWTDERIKAQTGIFSVVADPSVDFAYVLKRIPQSARKVIVPAGVKRELRERLDRAGNDERRFFPGLDGVSRYIARQHTE